MKRHRADFLFGELLILHIFIKFISYHRNFEFSGIFSRFLLRYFCSRAEVTRRAWARVARGDGQSAACGSADSEAVSAVGVRRQIESMSGKEAWQVSPTVIWESESSTGLHPENQGVWPCRADESLLGDRTGIWGAKLRRPSALGSAVSATDLFRRPAFAQRCRREVRGAGSAAPCQLWVLQVCRGPGCLLPSRSGAQDKLVFGVG